MVLAALRLRNLRPRLGGLRYEMLYESFYFGTVYDTGIEQKEPLYRCWEMAAFTVNTV